jgi:hypothetical protein
MDTINIQDLLGTTIEDLIAEAFEQGYSLGVKEEQTRIINAITSEPHTVDSDTDTNTDTTTVELDEDREIFRRTRWCKSHVDIIRKAFDEAPGRSYGSVPVRFDLDKLSAELNRTKSSIQARISKMDRGLC